MTSQDRLFIGLAGPDMPEVRAELGKLLEEIANGDISVKPLTHAASTSTPTEPGKSAPAPGTAPATLPSNPLQSDVGAETKCSDR